jgi:hypothetical protein
MILFDRYGEAPIRVVRKSRPDEYGHQRFYDRLGYVYTYSGHVDAGDDDPGSSPEARRRFFLDAAGSYLQMGKNVVICPEGACAATEQSPLRFRPGAFRLAGHVRPEPPLVPIAVANFDKKLTRATTVAVVHEPFRLSDVVADPADDEALLDFINARLGPQFRAWVQEAAENVVGQPEPDQGRAAHQLGEVHRVEIAQDHHEVLGGVLGAAGQVAVDLGRGAGAGEQPPALGPAEGRHRHRQQVGLPAQGLGHERQAAGEARPLQHRPRHRPAQQLAAHPDRPQVVADRAPQRVPLGRLDPGQDPPPPRRRRQGGPGPPPAADVHADHVQAGPRPPPPGRAASP